MFSAVLSLVERVETDQNVMLSQTEMKSHILYAGPARVYRSIVVVSLLASSSGHDARSHSCRASDQQEASIFTGSITIPPLSAILDGAAPTSSPHP